MRLYIAFDDTDNLETPGTGHLLEDFRSLAEQKNWGATQRITRHQLFFHPDVPYTSHNSAMCFILETEKDRLSEVESEAADFLKNRSAAGSDPGLCIIAEDELKAPQTLASFGKKAKIEVLNKKMAYETALSCGARLSEHGGTGGGIIGALAGAALRLEGNDGRYRGQLEGLCEDSVISGDELVNHPGIDKFALLSPESSIDSIIYPKQLPEKVFLRDKPKTINLKGASVFLLTIPEPKHNKQYAQFVNWTRQQLKRF